MHIFSKLSERCIACGEGRDMIEEKGNPPCTAVVRVREIIDVRGPTWIKKPIIT